MSPSNSVAQSRLQLILNKSKEMGVNHEMLMRRYVFDRFLKRVAVSPYNDAFVLKGAMALNAYLPDINRPTRDMDFHGMNAEQRNNALNIIKEIVSIDLGEEDGIEFIRDAFSVEPIQVKQEEKGVRITGLATMIRARIPLKIEISFGQVLTPDAQLVTLPTVLPDSSETRIRIYSRETILAEKFETVISRGVGNTRFKDFYDIRTLAQTQHLTGDIVAAAFRNTFKHRGTTIPREPPPAYQSEFIESIGEKSWKSLLKHNFLKEKTTFQSVVDEIKPFTLGFAQMALGLRPIEDWVPGEGGFVPAKGELVLSR